MAASDVEKVLRRTAHAVEVEIHLMVKIPFLDLLATDIALHDGILCFGFLELQPLDLGHRRNLLLAVWFD